MPTNSLGFFLVDLGHFVASVAQRMQDLVQLGMNGLSIAMLCALDDERHAQCRQCRHSVPLQSFRLENVPEHGIGNEHRECEWARGIDAEPGNESSHDQFLLAAL